MNLNYLPRLVRDLGKFQCLLTMREETDRVLRVRGYQFKSGGPNEVKRNPAAYRTLDDGKDKLANSAMPKPDADADELEAQGFAEKL